MHTVAYILKRTWKVLTVLTLIVLVAAFLFWQLEKGQFEPKDDFSYGTAVWYTLVTVSTVGYGDYYPKTPAGKFTMAFLIIFTFTNLGILMGMVNDTVLEAKERRELGLDGTNFENHIVVVGWSHISRIVLQELIGAGQRVAVVTGDRTELTAIRDMAPANQLFITVGDPTQEKSILRAGAKKARTAVLCADDDTHNLIMSLMIRDLNPKIRVIVSVAREELKRTLHSAGVTYVTSPFEMSGRLVASAAFEPEIAIFIDDITTAATGGFDLQQYTITAECPACNHSIGDFVEKMAEMEGALLVAMGQWDGRDWGILPHPDRTIVVKPNDIMITLGDDKQNNILREYLGVQQGR